jgi:hypothetical protein
MRHLYIESEIVLNVTHIGNGRDASFLCMLQLMPCNHGFGFGLLAVRESS